MQKPMEYCILQMQSLEKVQFRIKLDHLNLEAEGGKMFHKEKGAVAPHEGGNCGSRILSVHMYFCERNYGDKRG